eukprot:13578131-Ditylum_brightwellii.AAC.1
MPHLWADMVPPLWASLMASDLIPPGNLPSGSWELPGEVNQVLPSQHNQRVEQSSISSPDILLHLPEPQFPLAIPSHKGNNNQMHILRIDGDKSLIMPTIIDLVSSRLQQSSQTLEAFKNNKASKGEKKTNKTTTGPQHSKQIHKHP